MEVVSADIDQPAGMRILPALQRGRHALVGRAREDDEEKDGAAGKKRAPE
jgi:hypothetical protein